MKRKEVLGIKKNWFYKGDLNDLFSNDVSKEENINVKRITKVEFYNKIFMNDNISQVLVLECDEKVLFALDISFGLIINDKKFIKEINQSKCIKKVLYNYNENDYQDDIVLNGIYMVLLHKNTFLINRMKSVQLEKSDYMEFIDRHGNTFFIDIVSNNLYKRLNLYEVKHDYNSTRIIIYKEYEPIKVNICNFNNYFKKMIKNLKINL